MATNPAYQPKPTSKAVKRRKADGGGESQQDEAANLMPKNSPVATTSE